MKDKKECNTSQKNIDPSITIEIPQDFLEEGLEELLSRMLISKEREQAEERVKESKKLRQDIE